MTYRRAWTMRLLAGAEAAYDTAHAQIWPELVEQMRTDGVERFHLFRSGRTVFAFQERRTPFPDRSAPAAELSRRWWREMANLMETDSNGRPAQTLLHEVFALNHTPAAERETAP